MARKKLKDVAKIVKRVLEEEPYTRNNDSLLYIKVCAMLNPSVLELNFVDVMKNLEEYHLPSFESVSRSRRKVQECHSELAANDFTQNARNEQEKEFLKLARATL